MCQDIINKSNLEIIKKKSQKLKQLSCIYSLRDVFLGLKSHFKENPGLAAFF